MQHHVQATASPSDLAALEQQSIPAGADGQHLLGYTFAQLRQLVTHLGHAAFHGDQVGAFIYKHRVHTPDAMHNIPKALRQALQGYSLGRPHIDGVHVSSDGTRKYRFVAPDGGAFEAVYIPEVAKAGRTNTLCISSQTGCAVGCRFCFTASLRRNRNLSAHEIVGQVVAVRDDVASLGEGAQVTNIVFMGMGEPLLNYTHVVQAARILLEPWGLSFSSRRVTISTAGIVPRLLTLGHELPTQLAISLNATTDAIRTQIMPINKKWPLAVLLDAMRQYPLRPRRRITVEYVLLGGINDTLDDAERLAALLRDIPVKINLLPLNPHDRTIYTAPQPQDVHAFQQVLWRHRYNALVRTPRGQDIQAACGQLGESVTPGAVAR